MKSCKYIVISHGRTGSTILTRMLRAHSRIVDYQELFNVDYQAEFRRGSDRARSLRYWLDAIDRRKLRAPAPAADLASVDEAAILEALDALLARYAVERETDEHFGDYLVRAGIVRDRRIPLEVAA